jgi:hypothetical protein
MTFPGSPQSHCEFLPPHTVPRHKCDLTIRLLNLLTATPLSQTRTQHANKKRHDVGTLTFSSFLIYAVCLITNSKKLCCPDDLSQNHNCNSIKDNLNHHDPSTLFLSRSQGLHASSFTSSRQRNKSRSEANQLVIALFTAVRCTSSTSFISQARQESSSPIRTEHQISIGNPQKSKRRCVATKHQECRRYLHSVEQNERSCLHTLGEYPRIFSPLFGGQSVLGNGSRTC